MQSIYNLTLNDLEEYFLSINDKKYRASQVFEWLYRKRVNNPDEMTNLSKNVIEHLKQDFSFELLEIETCQEASDGTKKYLFKLADGSFIETVLMVHEYGKSICVTSEVGCNMGCAFCASGMLGCKRKLEVSEMVLQVLTVQKELDFFNERITNIVVMGIGEPFDNYENLLKFLTIVNYPKGLEIGARHITVSTCGIVPKIREFADFPLQINLAVSLHAPTNELRSKLMKINKAYPIEEIIEALKYYFDKTGRRITFEYILLAGVNDSMKNAHDLAKLIAGLNAYVNLIPYNEVETKPFKTTSHEAAEAFFKILYDHHIQATLRMKHGDDIDAACGQLRAKVLKKHE